MVTKPDADAESTQRNNTLLLITALGGAATVGDMLSHAGIMIVVVLLLWGDSGM